MTVPRGSTWHAGGVAETNVSDDGRVTITDQGETLTYTGLEVIRPDGTAISHESRGGSLVSAAAVTVGEVFVEISHVGDGPEGGELVMVATFPDGSTSVALGGLVSKERPAAVSESWPAAVDLTLGLFEEETIDSGTKSEVEDFLQVLLSVMYAG